ncbi:hypothetical protein [Nonomuraea salmonea]|uniref:hypothetical protein n=1 Tax=Nonomuraea salmonea TaxID=46181 RepID=UPI0031F0D37A
MASWTGIIRKNAVALRGARHAEVAAHLHLGEHRPYRAGDVFAELADEEHLRGRAQGQRRAEVGQQGAPGQHGSEQRGDHRDQRAGERGDRQPGEPGHHGVPLPDHRPCAEAERDGQEAVSHQPASR